MDETDQSLPAPGQPHHDAAQPDVPAPESLPAGSQPAAEPPRAEVPEAAADQPDSGNTAPRPAETEHTQGAGSQAEHSEAEHSEADSTEAPQSEAEAQPAEPTASSNGAAPAAAEADASAAEQDEPDISKMDWYVLKVQSNREESIKTGLLRRAKIAGLNRYFGEVIVPTEMVTEFKNGKKRIVKRKLWPGYIIVQMEINDETWFLVRETPGIGDFTGAGGKPVPMLPHEIERFLRKPEEGEEEQPKIDIKFKQGDRVKINEGTFENFEGEVDHIDESNGRVTVMINIFGRSTPVELEYWQVEAV